MRYKSTTGFTRGMSKTDSLNSPIETSQSKPVRNEVLKLILDKVERIDFREKVLEKSGKEINTLKQKQAVVIIVDEVARIAIEYEYDLCVVNDTILFYNGYCWKEANRNEFKIFLATAAEKMGYDVLDCRHYTFRNELYLQFLAVSLFPIPEPEENTTLINLKNGTLEISPDGATLREHRKEDFLTYQLPFEYNPNADCPKWINFLDEMQPDAEAQKVLSEYMGYVFTRHLKPEKVLVLYGSGGNGKSVFFDIMSAIFGKDNITNYSLSELNLEHYRAAINNKILNYGSEIDGDKINPDTWKKLASGESISMRHKYGNPFNSDKYAKLIFNCNTLPVVKEYTEAFFRRFLIIPFDRKPKKKDISLARKIIESELAGVLNWILIGLERLLKSKDFTHCQRSQKILKQYRIESDSVAMFIEDEHLIPDYDTHISLKTMLYDYRSYCIDNGYKAVARGKLKTRLEYYGLTNKKTNKGICINAKREKK